MSNIKRNIPRGPVTLDELLNRFGDAAIKASRKTFGTPDHRLACKQVTIARRAILDHVERRNLQHTKFSGGER